MELPSGELARYIHRSGAYCPRCGGEHNEWGSLAWEERGSSGPIECLDCGFVWTEIHTISAVEYTMPVEYTTSLELPGKPAKIKEITLLDRIADLISERAEGLLDDNGSGEDACLLLANEIINNLPFVIVEVLGGNVQRVVNNGISVRVVDWDKIDVHCPKCGGSNFHTDISTSGDWLVCNKCNFNFPYREEDDYGK